jgi:hypothetical protein
MTVLESLICYDSLSDSQNLIFCILIVYLVYRIVPAILSDSKNYTRHLHCTVCNSPKCERVLISYTTWVATVVAQLFPHPTTYLTHNVMWILFQLDCVFALESEMKSLELTVASTLLLLVPRHVYNLLNWFLGTFRQMKMSRVITVGL